jgi:hypothetical protein
MNKKMISSLLFILTLFIFSCGEGSVKTAKTIDEVGPGSTAPVARVLPVVQQPGSAQSQSGTRYKKKSCCVAAPSRFKKILASQ